MKTNESYLRPEAEQILLSPEVACMVTTSTVVDDYPDPFATGEKW